MGLDLVEMVMGFEEAFGISIPDKDAITLQSPRLVMDYMEKRLTLAATAPCLSQRAFYLLRAAVVNDFGVERAEVRPDARWDVLLPRTIRRRAWDRMRQLVPTPEWLPLNRPRILSAAIGITASVVAVFVWAQPLAILSAPLAFLAAIGFAYLALLATRPLQVIPPDNVATVGALTEHLAALAPAALKQSARQWTRSEIESTVRAVVRHQLGIDEFSDDANFVRDLGVE